MFLVPVAFAFFFVDLMKEGLPLQTPVAVVDLDQSSMSRQVTRTLSSLDVLKVDRKLESYHQALNQVRAGDIFGFFLIPTDFEAKTVNGEKPTLAFYSNLTYYVPGTFAFKGFTTVAVTTTAGVVVTELQAAGVSSEAAAGLLQPVSIQNHPLHNPWLNYTVYLSFSFISGVFALMIMLMTCYSICSEIKEHSSPQWLARADGSIVTALVGKLLPQTVMWTAIGLFINAYLFGWNHFPLNNHASHMVLATVLTVIACQAFSLIITEIIPNLRLALSINSLVGILSFSITGFSFPVQSMYGGIGIFSYLIPLRYYFLIYCDQTLNGIPIYYSRSYYIALLIFPIVAFAGLHKLRRHCLHPVYVP